MEILKNAILLFTATKNIYLDEMTVKDKKLILFELLNFTLGKGQV